MVTDEHIPVLEAAHGSLEYLMDRDYPQSYKALTVQHINGNEISWPGEEGQSFLGLACPGKSISSLS